MGPVCTSRCLKVSWRSLVLRAEVSTYLLHTHNLKLRRVDRKMYSEIELYFLQQCFNLESIHSSVKDT